MGKASNHSSFKTFRGALIEYTEAPSPLALYFEFNPTTMTRTRTVSIQTGGAPGTIGGYDFKNRSEASRVSQGVTPQPETTTAKILLDATDRMNGGDVVAAKYGIQPEIDILRMMLEPKSQSPEGAQTLAALGAGSGRAFSRQQYSSILLFQWGDVTLPVFMTQAQVEAKAFLPSLWPYRAEATLTLQIIESQNPFYTGELKRLVRSAEDRARSIRKE
ncbi:MAG: hypothetical protein RIT81_47100 [Deltaproteobacteria bacterium]